MSLFNSIELTFHETTIGSIAGFSPSFKGQKRPSLEVEHILMYPPCGVIKTREQADLAYALLSDTANIYAEPDESSSSGNGRRDVDFLRKQGYQIDSQYQYVERLSRDVLFYVPTERGRQQLISNLELYLYRLEQNKQACLDLDEE